MATRSRMKGIIISCPEISWEGEEKISLWLPYILAIPRRLTTQANQAVTLGLAIRIAKVIVGSDKWIQ